MITDPVERRRVFAEFVDEFNQRHGPDSPWRAVLEDWVAGPRLPRSVSATPTEATGRAPLGCAGRG
ncbi:MAG: hypothetical protein ABSH51_01400 [Solirubrobacteraceae bacterium]